MTQTTTNLLWIDLEMTGLDESIHHIIEIASIVTDKNLNILAEGPSIAIHQPSHILNLMDEWCVKTHGESGLTKRVQESHFSLEEAEQQTLAFAQQWIPDHTSPLCGNSIGSDRRFLKKYMPKIDTFCHYRNIDVSSIKEVIKRWYNVETPYKKQGTHVALDDIHESIAELKFYKDTYFISSL